MLYTALRDCYVYDVLHRKGENYELPDAAEISEKNFALAEQPAAVIEKTVRAKPQAKAKTEPKPETPAPANAPTLRAPKKHEYACVRCKKIHMITSKQGQKHLKFKPEGSNADSG